MAVYADNIKNKLGTLPSYKPSAADTFGDWSVEIGDIIPVYPDLSRQQLEKSQLQSLIANSLPVMNSDMSWNGAAQTTVECTGTAEREVQKKEERQSYTYENDVAKKLASYGGRIGDTEEYIKQVQVVFNGDGTSANAGILAFLNVDPITGHVSAAGATLSATINSKTAEMKTEVLQDVEGNYYSKATIDADFVSIESLNTKIQGFLDAESGVGIKGPLVVGGTLNANGGLNVSTNGGIRFGGGSTVYKPTDITSSDKKTHSVIGA